MPVIARELSNLIGCEEPIGEVLLAVKRIEEVLPPAMIPFVEMLECTKVMYDRVWLQGAAVAYEYCEQDAVLSAIQRILSALCKRPMTITLRYNAAADQAETERRRIEFLKRRPLR